MAKYYTINDNSTDFKMSKGNVEDSVKEFKYNDSIKLSDANSDYEVYNIITTSDKKINSRKYPDAFVKKTVLDNAWVKPFHRPVLTNHDSYSEPRGRVMDAFYIKHSNYDVTSGSGTGTVLPDEVIMHYADRGAFKIGTGSVVGKLNVTKDTIQKIIDGVYLTTSQSSNSDALTCNVCGKEYYECDHRAGETYAIKNESGTVIDSKECVPETGNLFPIENSFVNEPANDTSTLCIWDKKNKKMVATCLDKPAEVDTKDNVVDNKHSIALKDNKEGGELMDEKIIRDSIIYVVMSKLNLKDSKKEAVKEAMTKIKTDSLLGCAELLDTLAMKDEVVAEPAKVEPVAEPVVDSKELDEAKVKIADTENEVKELKATIADLQKSLEGVKVVDVKETVPAKVEPVVDFFGAKTGTPAGSTSISLKDKFKI